LGDWIGPGPADRGTKLGDCVGTVEGDDTWDTGVGCERGERCGITPSCGTSGKLCTPSTLPAIPKERRAWGLRFIMVRWGACMGDAAGC
jgi:hypothetical protein